jgi:hypothetical protein
MTDKEKLENLFMEFGLGFSENKQQINLEVGFTKVDGYSGFCVKFNFDDNGNFKDAGIWE